MNPNMYHLKIEIDADSPNKLLSLYAGGDLDTRVDYLVQHPDKCKDSYTTPDGCVHIELVRPMTQTRLLGLMGADLSRLASRIDKVFPDGSDLAELVKKLQVNQQSAFDFAAKVEREEKKP